MAEHIIQLPTLHSGQVEAYHSLTEYSALRCGRRFGKTDLLGTIGLDAVCKGQKVGYFAPDYKRTSEFYSWCKDRLAPIMKQSSQTAGIIKTINGGSVELWTLNDVMAGRSRHYHLALIDEAAFTKNDLMMIVWEQAIKPTLFDYSGRCIVASNTNGVDPENFFYRICNDPKFGFSQFHAPTSANPLLPMRLPGEAKLNWQIRREAALQKLKDDNPPLVYQQEYLAEFVDWSGETFFSRDCLLVEGQPVPTPHLCDSVFATVDTATKTGSDNDGTAVIYWARNIHVIGHPLTILGWDIVQIEGALLETWLPTVFQQLEHYAELCKARYGSQGAWIEDKSSGMVLIQQSQRKGWPAQAIDGKITSLGKDERAISISGYIYRGEVKICQEAFEKVMAYKGTTRNHLLSQISGFRVGDRDAAKRADDLLDCFVYGPAIALGNWEGF